VTRFDVQHRDCFDSLAAMRDAGGVDLVVTSPPYPSARRPGVYGAEFDTSLTGYHRLGEAVYQALRPGGICAIVIDGPIREWRSVAPGAVQADHPIGGNSTESERSLIAFKVAIDWAEQIGFRFVEHGAYDRRAVQDTDPDHAAPFARTLADDYVLCYSPPGGTVGDPFVGSGTVAYSCHRHGRRFIGGDLGIRQRDGRRWADVVNDGLAQTTLFDHLEPT
jgi:DNA modification methylase